MYRSRAMVAVVVMAAALMLTMGAASAQDPSVSVDPSSGLVDGDTVTVTATGFPADSTAFVSGQCVTPITDPLQQCDTGNIVPVALDASGEATFDITLSTGAIGSGTCGAGGDDCVIMVGSLTQAEFGFAPIAFDDGELALTGPRDLVMLVGAGFALLAVGSMLASRSRKVAIAV
jgi:hypothetical protein